MSPTKVTKNKVSTTEPAHKALTKKAHSRPQQQQQQQEEEEEDDEELCFICTEPVTIYAVSNCDHRTCYTCALRLRALYETRNCAYCKSEQPVIIFTKDDKKPFDSYNLERDTPFVDKKMNIRFETQDMYREAMHMLDYNCPMQKLSAVEEGDRETRCRQVCQNWNDLKQHVMKAHKMNLCDLCTRFKKIFPYEHTLYTPSQLLIHCKEGDKSFLPDDETGFSGHPECGFCKKRYFSDDELFIHCRDSHEQCFLCVKMHGRRHEYYENYDQLEEHFKSEHFLCLNKSCLEKKFVVFGTDIDLRAHDVEVHGGSRQLDLNLFQYETVRNQRKQKGKGKATAASIGEGATPSSAFEAGLFPGVRDHSQGSSSNGQNRHAGQSDREEFPAMKSKEQSKAAENKTTKPRIVPGASGLKKGKGKGKAIQKPVGFGALSSSSAPSEEIDFDHNTAYNEASSSLTSTSAAAATTNHSTVAQHQAFLSKVGDMLQSKAKVAEFKSLTKAYRNNTMPGEDYVNQIALLTNQNVEHTGKILKGVENLMDKEEKKWELLRLWRNKQTAMTQFPALEVKDHPLVASSKPPSRVLVIKGPDNRQLRKAIVGASSSASTSNKNKTSHQQKNVWDNVATAANRANGIHSNTSSARTSPQSSRPASPSPSTPNKPSPVSNNAYNSFFPTMNTKSTTPSFATTNKKSIPPKPTNTAAFPALPTASRTKHDIILNMRSNKMGQQNAWDASCAASVNSTQTNSDPSTSGTQNGNTKKKKGRKNNVLFRVGL